MTQLLKTYVVHIKRQAEVFIEKYWRNIILGMVINALKFMRLVVSNAFFCNFFGEL